MFKLFITVLFVFAMQKPVQADAGDGVVASPAEAVTDSGVTAQTAIDTGVAVVAEPAVEAVVPAVTEPAVDTGVTLAPAVVVTAPVAKRHSARAKKTAKRGSGKKKRTTKRRAASAKAVSSPVTPASPPVAQQKPANAPITATQKKTYAARQHINHARSALAPAELKAAPSAKQLAMRAKEALKPAVLKNVQAVKQPVRHTNAVLKPAPSKNAPTEPESAVPVKASLKPATSKSGYIARMLINEAVFPGEDGWVSEENSEAAMLAMLWVCHGRIHYVPPHYTRMEIAATSSTDIIDIITAGGERGQVDGFYRDKNGAFKCIPRVHERVKGLLEIASRGTPGRIARMLIYAQGLSDAYVSEGIKGADRYAGLRLINGVRVTGRAYSWMTDEDYYNPGGDFVRIPNAHDGSLGGNRFFTLKELAR